MATAEQRSAAARKAGLARAKSFTREHQQRAAKSSRNNRTREHQASAGRARMDALTSTERAQLASSGYKCAAAKYGKYFASTKAREYRLGHPTELEKEAIKLLKDAGIACTREWELNNLSGVDYSPMCVDFKINNANICIEIDGPCHTESWADDGGKRQAERARKLAILAQHGLTLVVLDWRTQHEWRAQLDELKATCNL